jgi:hypothetical protein
MSGAAARMRLLRARQRVGRICLEIEIDEIEAAQTLIHADALTEKLTGDYSRIELARAVERLIAEILPRDTSRRR